MINPLAMLNRQLQKQVVENQKNIENLENQKNIENIENLAKNVNLIKYFYNRSNTRQMFNFFIKSAF